MTEPGAPDRSARGRALVVDDADDLRLLLEQVLQADGFDAVGAASGSEALETLRELGPAQVSVVILDVQMPVVDGWRVLECIRAEPALYGRPAVLLCTVKNSAADRERAVAMGADDYLSKPFAIAELTEKVARLTSTRRH